MSLYLCLHVTHVDSHTLGARQKVRHLHSLSLSALLFLFLSLPFTLYRAPLQHMPTHAAAQAHVIWNCISPSFSLLSRSGSLSPCLSYLSLTYIHVHVPWRSDSERVDQASSPSLSLSLFFLQFKLRTHFIASTIEGTCAAWAEDYVIIRDSLMARNQHESDGSQRWAFLNLWISFKKPHCEHTLFWYVKFTQEQSLSLVIKLIICSFSVYALNLRLLYFI